MIIDCISDLYGHYPKLDGGDLLIVAGDLTGTDSINEHMEFCRWICKQNYKKKIFISGNHDNKLVGPWPGNTKGPFREDKAFYDFDYLCDSGTEFEGLKIWGSPWTKSFPGMNPHCKAFTVDTEEELQEKWKLIPDDIDILVTHSPSFGNLDVTKRGESVGSMSLWIRLLITRPKLHVFGHVHESYGNVKHYNGIRLVNASHVNERYEPVNNPIRIIL